MQFSIRFCGHQNIRALHKKTIEITTKSELTASGDCIIGVNAVCGCKGIPKQLKKKLKKPDTNITATIVVNDYSFTMEGKGHPNISCTDSEDIVLRKSNYVCPRTLAVSCDKAADSISRDIVQQLQNPKTKGKMIIEIT